MVACPPSSLGQVGDNAPTLEIHKRVAVHVLFLHEMGTLNPHAISCADPEGGGGRDPLENHRAIGFLSNTGPDSLETHKATKPVFNIGPPSARQRNAI